jgi:hypothetical protein
MQSDKKCLICGQPGAARVNGKAWLCEQHAREATDFSLKIGQPVIWAFKGVPRYLIMPNGIHRN